MQQIIRIDDQIYDANTGCPEYGIASCFTCILPACRYDMKPKQASGMTIAMRVQAMLREGLSGAEVAGRLGVSVRTVYRIKRQWRIYQEHSTWGVAK